MSKGIASSRLGSLGSGAVTGAALAVQTGLAAVVGIVLARGFGRGAETDGFFSAYVVFVAVLLAAHAIRVTVLPSFARAREDGRLGGELAAVGLVLAALALPVSVVSFIAAGPIAGALTGDTSGLSRQTAADALPWMTTAAVLQLFAGLAASALAALDDYVTAAVGFALGSIAGVVLIVLRVGPNGVQAISWGMALNGAVALGVLTAALGLRAWVVRTPRSAARPGGAAVGSRLAVLGAGIALPLALQGIYVVCNRLAYGEGEGAQTSIGYGYLITSAVVAMTASSLGLVTAVPLTRTGLDAVRTARHVVSSAWIALVVIGASAGVFGLAGGRIVGTLLGSSYSSAAGDELGRLVVVLSLWAVASVGVSVTFPLVFVAGRSRTLPLIALAALALHVPVAWAGQRLLGLDGLALALAITTAAVLAVLLAQLHALAATARGLALASLAVAALAVVAFVPPALVLAPPAAAIVGLAAYAALVGLVRPAGLREAWQYLRAFA